VLILYELFAKIGHWDQTFRRECWDKRDYLDVNIQGRYLYVLQLKLYTIDVYEVFARCPNTPPLHRLELPGPIVDFRCNYNWRSHRCG
jgi:hypothetical protein